MKHILVLLALWCCALSGLAQNDNDSIVRRNVYDVESNMLNYTYNRNPGYDHIKNAGRYHRKAYAFEVAFIPLPVTAGYMIGRGYDNENDKLKVMGYVVGGLAVVDAIFALTYHFKTGKELELSADYIRFKF